MSKQMRDLDVERFLTVGEAAERLCVHPSTIRRWIDHGKLRAYRLGDRRVGIRAPDLAQLVKPRGAQLEAEEAGPSDIAPMTKEKQERALRVLAEIDLIRETLAARHGKFTPESGELINEARDDRTRELMRASEE
jgi:excisionase family DNA binding protein